MALSFRLFDYLVFVYAGIAAAFLLIGAAWDATYVIYSALHGAAAVGVWLLIRRGDSLPFFYWLRWGYPLLFLVPLYWSTDAVAILLHGDHTFDPLLAAWDQAFFGFHPHEYFAAWLSGAIWSEIFHGAYLAYFPLLVGSYVWVLAQRPDEAPRFAFIFTGMYLTYMVVFMLFPAGGPMAERGDRFASAGLLTVMVEWVYLIGEPGTIRTAAFPSSHVGMGVGIYLLLRPMRALTHVFLLAIVAGIVLSTVYGWFHYAIDPLAGLISGVLFYVIWSYLYHQLRPLTVSSEAQSTRRSA